MAQSKAIYKLGLEVYRYSKIIRQLSEFFGKNQKSVFGKLPIFDYRFSIKE